MHAYGRLLRPKRDGGLRGSVAERRETGGRGEDWVTG